MNLDILPNGQVDLEMMRDLGELCDRLIEAGVPARRSTVALSGIKDAGLTVAIAIGGLAVSALSSAVSVLTYWSSHKPRYIVTVQAGRVTLQASGLDPEGVRALLREVREEEDAESAVVRVCLK